MLGDSERAILRNATSSVVEYVRSAAEAEVVSL